MAACVGYQNIEVIKFLVTDVRIDINKKCSSNVSGLFICINHNGGDDDVIKYLENETDIEISFINDYFINEKISKMLSFIIDHDKVNNVINNIVEKMSENNKNLIRKITKESKINPFILTENVLI